MESYRPKAVISSAVHPAMPTIIIIILLLNLKTFLTDTLCRKRIFDQMKPILSRMIRLPGGGALGLMSSAGIPLSSDTQVKTVTPTVQMSAKTNDMTNISTEFLKDTSAKPYIILYTSQMTHGNSFIPPR